MASRSAAQRTKRKRDSTSQAVDFLNSIHNPTDRVSHSSPVRSRHPLRRQTARRRRTSQGDTILGSPQSAEESRSAKSSPQSEPITPERSKRRHDQSGKENIPNLPIPIVQLDGSAYTKPERDYVAVSNDGSDHGSGSDSEESEENNQNTDKATPQRFMRKTSPQHHEQDANTHRGSTDGCSSRSRAESDSALESEVDHESSDESSHEGSYDSSDENSDGSSDEHENLIEIESNQARRQSVSENSLAQLFIQEEPDESVGPGEEDGSDSGSEDVVQSNTPKLEEISNLTDENMQDSFEDFLRVRLFTDESDDDSDNDSERESKSFSPSKQLQYEQEMNVSSDRVTEAATIPDSGKGMNPDSQGVTENATTLSFEQETNVNSQDAANDTAMSDYEQVTNPQGNEMAGDAAEEEYVPSGKESVSDEYTDASDLESTEGILSAAASAKGRSQPEDDQRQELVAEVPGQQRTSSLSPNLQDGNSSSDEQNASFASKKSTEKFPNEEEVSWFAKAKALGGQEENWNFLISEALAASEIVSPSRDHYFREIESSIVSLHEGYAAIVDSLENQHRPTSATRQEYERLRRHIGDQGNTLLDRIWYRAIKQGDQNKLLSGKLAEAFEAHVYYPMVMLILECFKAYSHPAMHQLFPRAHDHLLQAMKLLQGFCSRCRAQEVTGCVSFRSRGGALIKKLEALVKALQNGALSQSAAASGSEGNHRRRRQPSTTQQIFDVESTPPLRREWTEEEGFALLQGLRCFQGKWSKTRTVRVDIDRSADHGLTLISGAERYRQILEQFPSQLEGRTIQELRDQTQLLRDTWAPKIAAARTQEQRQKWQFLQV